MFTFEDAVFQILALTCFYFFRRRIFARARKNLSACTHSFIDSHMWNDRPILYETIDPYYMERSIHII